MPSFCGFCILWGRFLVTRIMSHLTLCYPFVLWRPEGFYRLANGIDEQRTVGKWKPQADPNSGEILDDQWCVCSLWTESLLVRHLYKGEKSLIIKVDSNTSLCCSKQESAQSSLPMHHRYVLSEKGWLDARLLQWLSWPVGYPALLNLEAYARKERVTGIQKISGS